MELYIFGRFLVLDGKALREKQLRVNEWIQKRRPKRLALQRRAGLKDQRYMEE